MKSISLVKDAVTKMRTQGISMRRRFVLCLLATLFCAVALMYLLLNIFGVVNPTDNAIDRALSQQLEYTVRDINESTDALAAYAVAFSKEITLDIKKSGYTFNELKNNKEALTAIQEEAYDSVYANMRLAECSGAFYFLNTTVNDSLPDTYYNGVYLKFAALSASVTVRSEVVMFRGNSQVARNNDINLHSTWEYETKVGTFPQVEELLSSVEENPSKNYVLTSVYKLPQAWEHVRFLCVPVSDDEGNVIGVCGFEISDLYFQQYQQTSNSEYKQTLCALLTEHNGVITGQISGNRDYYMPHLHKELTVKESGRFSVISDGEQSFIGNVTKIFIGNENHIVAVVLSQESFDRYVAEGRIKVIGLLALVAVLAIVVSVWLSKKYVTPFIRAMEHIKQNQTADAKRVRVPEIDDLFDFLARQDRERDAEVSRHRQRSETLQSEVDRLSTEKSELQSRAAQVQLDNARLAYLRKEEIDPDSYQRFLECLLSLSKREKEVFNLYVEGKSAKEIAEVLGITDNGLKYHNKNIYSKLGVSSRKELLRYVTIMKQDEGGNVKK